MCLGINYQRWSSERQTDSDSKRRQSEGYLTFCKMHKLTTTDLTYVDAGVSGWKGKNVTEGKFKSLLRAIEKGEIRKGSCIVIEQFDRASREDVDIALPLITSILRKGVLIGHVRRNKIYTKDDIKGFAILEMIMELILAAEESNKKSERVQASLHANQDAARKDGKIWTSKGPAWLRLSADRSRWIVIEAEKKKVEYIFDLCIQGLGVEAICKRLVAEGVKPLGKAKKWNRNYIRHLLRGRIVLGEYQPTTGGNAKTPHGQPIKDYYTPIIDEDTYYKAQAQLDQRRRKRGPTSKYVNIFGGLLRDTATDSTMYLASKPQKDGSIQKAVYPSASINGAGGYYSVRMDYLETALLTAIPAHEVADAQDTSELQTLENKRQDLLRRLDALNKEIADTPDFAYAMTLAKTLDADLRQVDEEIDLAKQKASNKPQTALEQCVRAIDAFQPDNSKDARLALRAALRQLVTSIDVTDLGKQVMLCVWYVDGSSRLVRLDKKTGDYLLLTTDA